MLRSCPRKHATTGTPVRVHQAIMHRMPGGSVAGVDVVISTVAAAQADLCVGSKSGDGRQVYASSELRIGVVCSANPTDCRDLACPGHEVLHSHESEFTKTRQLALFSADFILELSPALRREEEDAGVFLA